MLHVSRLVVVFSDRPLPGIGTLRSPLCSVHWALTSEPYVTFNTLKFTLRWVYWFVSNDARDERNRERLNSLHATLLEDVRSDTDAVGEPRTGPVHPGRYVPPVPEVVLGAMDAFLTYVRTGGVYHDLIDIASRLEDAGVLEEVTERDYGREYRATETFEILERPPRTY